MLTVCLHNPAVGFKTNKNLSSENFQTKIAHVFRNFLNSDFTKVACKNVIDHELRRAVLGIAFFLLGDLTIFLVFQHFFMFP